MAPALLLKGLLLGSTNNLTVGLILFTFYVMEISH